LKHPASHTAHATPHAAHATEHAAHATAHSNLTWPIASWIQHTGQKCAIVRVVRGRDDEVHHPIDLYNVLVTWASFGFFIFLCRDQ
jgi:hypothetical protein